MKKRWHTFFGTNFRSHSNFSCLGRLRQWGGHSAHTATRVRLSLGRRLAFTEIAFCGLEGFETIAGFLMTFCEHSDFDFDFVGFLLTFRCSLLLSLAGVDTCKISRHPGLCIVAVVLEDACCMRTLKFCGCSFIALPSPGATMRSDGIHASRTRGNYNNIASIDLLCKRSIRIG